MTPEQIGQLDPEERHPITPGAHDAAARLRDMDAMGIDRALLFPTLFAEHFPLLENPDVAWALARAYNDWIVDFAAADRRRLIPVAVLPMQAPSFAVRELERVAARGVKAAFVRPSFFEGRYPNHPLYDPVWQRLEALDIAACVHPSPGSTNPEWSCAGPFVERVAGNLRIGHPIAEAVAPFMDASTLLTALAFYGHMEIYPKLRLTLVHAGAAWVPLALEKSETYLWLFSGIRDVSLEPEHVFFDRPSLVSFDSWEAPVARMPDVFENVAAWGSRYPNHDTGTVEEARATMAKYGCRGDGREVPRRTPSGTSASPERTGTAGRARRPPGRTRPRTRARLVRAGAPSSDPGRPRRARRLLCSDGMRRLILAVLLGFAPAASAKPPIPFDLVSTLHDACFDCGFGPLAAVGAIECWSHGRTQPGAVDLYDPASGRLVRTFASREPEGTLDSFALSFGVVGERHLLVGAPWGTSTGDGGEVREGVAYLFDLETGVLRHLLTATTPRDGDRFGASVAALGTAALVYSVAESTVYAFDSETAALRRVYPAPLTPGRPNRERTIAALGADIVVGDAEAVYVLDGATGAVRFTIPVPDDAPIGARTVVHDGNVFVEGKRAVHRYDGRDGRFVRTYEGYQGPLAATECALLMRGPGCGDPGFGDAGYLIDADTGRTLAILCAADDGYAPNFPSFGAVVGRRLLLADPSEDEQTVFVFAPKLTRGVVAGVPGGRVVSRGRFPDACNRADLPHAFARHVRRARALLDGPTVARTAGRRAARLLARALRTIRTGRRGFEPSCRVALTAYLEGLAQLFRTPARRRESTPPRGRVPSPRRARRRPRRAAGRSSRPLRHRGSSAGHPSR
jgi:predicted TIM-barrel fold metal-dependent hydrolase